MEGGHYEITAPYDKAVKADTELHIASGSFVITSGDDALHSDGTISMEEESTDITISAADDAVHANETLTIDAGTMNITKSYEGLEAANITINGGEIHIVSSDDGINVAGGADSSGMTNGSGGQSGDMFRPGMPGGNAWGGNSGGSAETTENSDYSLVITGGNVYINANGDGLDSNGTITMSGGEVYVSGPTNSGNGAIDYERSFDISGGILVAVGAQGMDETPSTTSTQCSVRFALSSTQVAGTLVTLKDAAGNEVVSFTPEKQFNSVVISAPGLTQNSSYSLYLGDTLNKTVTLTSVVTGSSNSSQMPGRW